ncbi:hypothetical protein ACOSP7_022392 [Xanthoceras sorbifolium]
MIPEYFFTYGSILVRGHPVTLTPELVNNYFQVPNFPKPVSGWTVYEFFQLYNWDLAGSLRLNEVDRRWAQNLEHHESALHEHEQPQVQPQGEDRLLTALAGMVDRLATRMDAIEIRLTTSIDVMGFMEARLTTQTDAIENSMDRIRSTLFQTYARHQVLGFMP